jgi:hypothetical protein
VAVLATKGDHIQLRIAIAAAEQQVGLVARAAASDTLPAPSDGDDAASTSSTGYTEEIGIACAIGQMWTHNALLPHRRRTIHIELDVTQVGWICLSVFHNFTTKGGAMITHEKDQSRQTAYVPSGRNQES